MADPVTLEQAIDDLADTWAALGGYSYPTRPPIAIPDGSRPTRANAYAVRLACMPSDGRGSRGLVATPAATALRDALHLFVWGPWHSHPVAQAMARAQIEAHPGPPLPPPSPQAIPPRLADLDALPEEPPHRAAVLVATAYTARQEAQRLQARAAHVPADEARRLARQVAEYDDHHAAAMQRLASAWDAWLPGAFAALESVQTPAAPEGPTVPAVIRAGVGHTTD